MQMVFDSHAGMSQDDFMLMAKEFLETAKHPRFGMLYKDLTYKPMVELVHYLGDSGFKVFLASGGGMSFMRAVSEEIYNILYAGKPSAQAMMDLLGRRRKAERD